MTPADLAALHTKLDAVLRELRRHRAAGASEPTPVPDKLTLKAAAPIASVSAGRMRIIAVRYGIGSKVGGRWVVDRNKLFAHLRARGLLPAAYR